MYLESFYVHAVQHLGVVVAADIDHDVTVCLVRVDGVQEEERRCIVLHWQFQAGLARYQANTCLCKTKRFAYYTM